MPTFIPVKEWLADKSDEAKRRLDQTVAGIQQGGADAADAAGQALAQANREKEEWARQALEQAMAPLQGASDKFEESLSGLQNLRPGGPGGQDGSAPEPTPEPTPTPQATALPPAATPVTRNPEPPVSSQGPIIERGQPTPTPEPTPEPAVEAPPPEPPSSGGVGRAIGQRFSDLGSNVQGAIQGYKQRHEEGNRLLDESLGQRQSVQEQLQRPLSGPERPEMPISEDASAIEAGARETINQMQESAERLQQPETWGKTAEALKEIAPEALSPVQTGARLVSDAQARQKFKEEDLPAAGQVAQTAGDVFNLIPTGENVAGNVAYNVGVEALEDAGVPEPVAQGLGLVGSFGIPGAASTAGRRFRAPRAGASTPVDGAAKVDGGLGGLLKKIGGEEAPSGILPGAAAGTPGEPGYRYFGGREGDLRELDEFGNLAAGYDAKRDPSLALAEPTTGHQDQGVRPALFRAREEDISISPEGVLAQDIPAERVEVLGDDQQWHPAKGFMERPDYGIPTREMGGGPDAGLGAQPPTPGTGPLTPAEMDEYRAFGRRSYQDMTKEEDARYSQLARRLSEHGDNDWRLPRDPDAAPPEEVEHARQAGMDAIDRWYTEQQGKTPGEIDPTETLGRNRRRVLEDAGYDRDQLDQLSDRELGEMPDDEWMEGFPAGPPEGTMADPSGGRLIGDDDPWVTGEGQTPPGPSLGGGREVLDDAIMRMGNNPDPQEIADALRDAAGDAGYPRDLGGISDQELAGLTDEDFLRLLDDPNYRPGRGQLPPPEEPPDVEGIGTRALGSPWFHPARTSGERAFDLAGGTVGGALGAATAEEDATWQERLGRGLAGAALGAQAGPRWRSALRRGGFDPSPRALGRRLVEEMRDETGELRFGAAAGGEPPPPRGPGRPGRGPEYGGPDPSRESRDFSAARPSLNVLREAGDITALEYEDAVSHVQRIARNSRAAAAADPENADLAARAADDQEWANGYTEFARDLLTNPSEVAAQRELQRIKRAHGPEAYEAAKANLRGRPIQPPTPEMVPEGTGTGVGPGKGTPEGDGSTPVDSGKRPDEPLGPKPESERTPREYTPEQIAQREEERTRRAEARAREQRAREAERAAARAAYEAERDLQKAVDGEQRRAARERLRAAREAEKQAQRDADEARRTWEATGSGQATEGQMPLDIEGSEGMGAQMGLPTESGIPPLTDEQAEIAAKLREAEGQRIGGRRPQTEEDIAGENVITRMEKEAASRQRAETGEMLPRDATRTPLDRPPLDIETTQGQRRLGEEGPPLTPEQQEIAARLDESEAQRLKNRKRSKDPDDPGFWDWLVGLRYSGMLSRPANVMSDFGGGPSEGLWKIARDSVTETAGKVTGRGGHPTAVVAEAMAGLDAFTTEGWKVFLDEMRKRAPAGRPDAKTLARRTQQRQERVSRMIADRLKLGDTPERAAQVAERANPVPGEEESIVTALTQATPTEVGRSEVGRGLEARLKAKHDRWVAEGFPRRKRDVVAEKVAGTAVEGVGRLRTSLDAWNQHMFERMERSRQAAHQVIEEGGNPLLGEGRRRARQIESHPTEAQSQRAITEGQYGTFRNDPGDLGNRIATIQGNPIGQLMLPIFKTAYNLSRRGIERTPGIGTAVLAGESVRNKMSKNPNNPLAGTFGVERAGEKLSDQAVGLSVFMAAEQMAEAGIITGSGPDDQQTRDMMLAQGWRPHSVLIGDRYYSYERLPGPVAWPLALAGAVGEGHLFHKPDTDTLEYWTEVGRNMGSWGGNQLFIRSFGDLYNAITNADTEAGPWLSNLAGSFGGVVTGGLTGAVGEAFDPYEREVAGPAEGVQFRIPTARQDLPVKRDVLDNPVTNPEYGWGFVSPVRAGPSTSDINPDDRLLRRYIGSYSPGDDMRIAQAIRDMEDYYAGKAALPGPETQQLYNDFVGKENPAYTERMERSRSGRAQRELARLGLTG